MPRSCQSVIPPGQVIYSFLDVVFGAPRTCTWTVQVDTRVEAVEVQIEGGYVKRSDAQHAWGEQVKLPKLASDTDYGLP